MRCLVFVFAIIVLAAANQASDRYPPGRGPRIKNPNKEEDWRIVWGAVSGVLNDEINNKGLYHLVPIKLFWGEGGLAAGPTHEYELLVGESSCKKADLKAKQITRTNCPLRDGANRAIYHIHLYERPWENFAQYTIEKVRDVAASEVL